MRMVNLPLACSPASQYLVSCYVTLSPATSHPSHNNGIPKTDGNPAPVSLVVVTVMQFVETRGDWWGVGRWVGGMGDSVCVASVSVRCVCVASVSMLCVFVCV